MSSVAQHRERMISKVMWVLFGSSFCTFSNFYQLDSHNKTRVAFANLRYNTYKNWIENRTFPKLVMIIGSACLLISKLKHMSSQLCSLLSGVVVDIWRRNQISFTHVCFVMFACWSSLHHVSIRYRGPIKTTSHSRPIYLIRLSRVQFSLRKTNGYGIERGLRVSQGRPQPLVMAWGKVDWVLNSHFFQQAHVS
jgi:hypothetical protein